MNCGFPSENSSAVFGCAVWRLTVIFKVDSPRYAQLVWNNIKNKPKYTGTVFKNDQCKYFLWCVSNTSVKSFCWNVVNQNGILSFELWFLMSFILLQGLVFPDCTFYVCIIGDSYSVIICSVRRKDTYKEELSVLEVAVWASTKHFGFLGVYLALFQL